MKKITIVGAGFAALTAVKNLRKISRDIEITLVAPKAEFIYFPGTIWIPSGIRKPEDLMIPLANFFKRMNVNFHQANAVSLEDNGRALVTDNGKIRNDGLIIASGGRFIKKLPGIEHSITPCEGIPAVVKIRDKLKSMEGGTIAVGFSGNPNEPSSMRGGPMFEFLFGIDNQLKHEKRRDKFNLVFFSPTSKPGARLGPKAVTGLLREMKKRNIKTYLGSKLKKFTETEVITETDRFKADMILFMPGMTGNQWFDNTKLPRSPGGLIQANQYCQVEGFESVYVAGDSGSFPGPEWQPKQAHMADLQAEAAAVNLIDELHGKVPGKTFKSELICIIDSHNTGMLVFRTDKTNLILPSMRIFHWLKRLFEWWYLRQYH
jgi:sulfide:quinone oxidoreductase